MKDVIADCVSAPCPLDALAAAPIAVRRYQTRSVKPVLAGITYGVVAGVFVAALVCGLAFAVIYCSSTRRCRD